MSVPRTSGGVEKPKATLSDRVYFALYSRISNGDYAINQRLPSENTLSGELGVSRPVLRIALEKLRSEGIIYSRQGAGNFVRAAASKPVGFARVETLADVQRCYEFRITIETAAAECAALRQNKAVLDEIEHALDMMRMATGSREHREDADFAFHMAITKGANNQYFEASMRALREHIYVGMRMHGESLMTDGAVALQEVLEEHAAIFDAISARNGALAANLMRTHLEHSRDRLFGGGLLDLRMKDQPPHT